jgi:hypothetical protein
MEVFFMKSYIVTFLCLFLTLIITRLIHSVFNFEFSILENGFFSKEALIDLGIWALVFSIIFFVMNAIFHIKN